MATATTIDASQTRVANRGHVYVAPKGSTVPPDTTTPWDPAWMDVGFTDEKGVVLGKKDTKAAVSAWQTISPVRYILTGRELHAVFVMEQVNKVTLPLWAGEGAGAVAANGTVTGEFKLNISPNPPNDERMLGIEWTDDLQVVTHRLIISRGTVTDTADVPITRTGVITLGVTFTAMAIDAATPLATLIMKDPAMAP